MTEASELDRTIAHLQATLASGTLPKNQIERGEGLLARLTSPVRLTLIGFPGAGKTELLNLLVGARVLPTGVEMPTTDLSWGEVAEARIVKAGGGEDRLPWPVDPGYDWSEAVFVKVTHPNPSLKTLAFLEIVTDGSPQDLSSALNWAIPRTDITLWCTQGFNRLEHALWVQVPDTMKDHGNLVLTRADEMSKSGALAGALKRLTGIANEEFNGLYAVATLQYLAAMDASGNPPENVRKATGGGALVDAIRGHVDRGRQADLDGALVFLAKFGTDAVPEAAPAVATAPAPRPGVPPSPEAVPGVEDALKMVTESSAELAGLAGSADADAVLTACADTVVRLVMDFEGLRAADAALAEEIEEAHEMVVLMLLEGDTNSAADAATVLLQIRRELEFAAAA